MGSNPTITDFLKKMIMNKYPYRWTLKDAKFTKDKGKVFSCFACGGGSTMGYKLAGYDVIGCNEIDPRMMKLYVANHHPKYSYCEDIRTFNKRKDLPKELYQLDILDGSPPCSSFSMTGVREDGWGKEKKFREGQTKQVLDTLFFDFIDLAKELQPKVVIAENVKGLILGNAIKYVQRIYREFEKAGYTLCHTLLDASKMGVPQRRERVFFTAIRNDLLSKIPVKETLFEIIPEINLQFNEAPIYFREFYMPGVDDRPCGHGQMYQYWSKRKPGDKDFAAITQREFGVEKCFSNRIVSLDGICDTFTAEADCCYLYDEFRKPNKIESCCICTFPQDYDFCDEPYYYVGGMSVPPVMMAQVASRIWEQWLSKIE